jgi:DNA-binding response OmpR family regulator
VPKVLLVSDAPAVLDELRAVVDDGRTEVLEARRGQVVRDIVAAERPDLVVSDLQVGTMGGVAICLDLRLEESGGRLPHVPVLLLLDRRADVFLARRAGAEGFLVKPLDPLRVRQAVDALLEGGTFHDETYAPASEIASP